MKRVKTRKRKSANWKFLFVYCCRSGCIQRNRILFLYSAAQQHRHTQNPFPHYFAILAMAKALSQILGSADFASRDVAAAYRSTKDIPGFGPSSLVIATALSAYVKAMEHGSELRDNENAVACFYRILRNAIADHYRRGGACARAHERFAAEAPTSFKPELEQTACACIKDVMRELKAEYRTAIERVDLVR